MLAILELPLLFVHDVQSSLVFRLKVFSYSLRPRSRSRGVVLVEWSHVHATRADQVLLADDMAADSPPFPAAQWDLLLWLG
mmetsp:Transcript_30868/g.47261  ORF Transcript_30868/g.47261 Transcript_30868/m.47261 type:complete len:81 (-) Transcript_30868:21-263(-)